MADPPTLRSSLPPLVLLADDHQDTKDLYRCWLERGGLHVVDAASGEEALTLVALLGPRIVITEMGLPRMDGYELCRRMRLHPDTRHIPIIGVTGRVMPHEVQRAWEAGCDAVLAKPCLPETLLAEILRLLGLPSVRAARAV